MPAGPALKPMIDIGQAMAALRPGAPRPKRRGQAGQASQTVREPVFLIGQSGKLYGVAGEGGNERIAIGDAEGPGARVPGAPGVRAYQTGGVVDVLAEVERNLGHALTADQRALFDANVGNVVNPGAPRITPPRFAGSGGLLPGTTQGPSGPQTAQFGAAQGVISASQAQIDAQTAALGAAGTAAGASTAYLNEQARAGAAARAERERIIAARGNAQNIIDVARGNRDRRAQDYKYGIAGLDVPAELVLPEGFAGPLPPGVRRKIETDEERLTREAADSEALRQSTLDQARIAAARAGLTVDEAQRRAQGAALGVSQANLNLDRTQTPPGPGLVMDDNGNWVTAAEARLTAAQNNLVVDPSDRTGATLVTRADLASRTDQFGNVRRASDGVVVSPEGNEFRNGQWVDPRTGNVFYPNMGNLGAWVAPNGNIYFITNPETGAGYWTAPDGVTRLDLPPSQGAGSVLPGPDE